MRQHRHAIELPIEPERAFRLLHTPSDIRGWWLANRAIVIPRQDGMWAAAWGSAEDDPDYTTIARIAAFEPPRRLVLADFHYFAKTGPFPFDANIVTEFQVEPAPGACVLRVLQTGFPDDAVADAFYTGCEIGWRQTFALIRQYVVERVSSIAV